MEGSVVKHDQDVWPTVTKISGPLDLYANSVIFPFWNREVNNDAVVR